MRHYCIRERPQYELALLTSGLDPGHMYLRYGPPLSDDVHPVLRPDDGPGPEPLPRPDDGPAPAHRQLRPTLRARQLLRLLLRLLRLLLGEHGPAGDGGHGEDRGESGHSFRLGWFGGILLLPSLVGRTQLIPFTCPENMISFDSIFFSRC